MLDWETIAVARAGNSELKLVNHGSDWGVLVDGRMLMSNQVHGSEVALAEEGIDRAERAEHVLIGGLGLGYTLRATLDIVAPTARVTVAELVGELVQWNREYLGHLNDDPCDDPRCEIVVDDAFNVISQSRSEFDVILLDTDNGPESLSSAKNQRIYGEAGVRACWNALRPGGVLAVWSAGPSAKYAQRLDRYGFCPELVRVPVTTGARGMHVIFVGTKPDN